MDFHAYVTFIVEVMADSFQPAAVIILDDTAFHRVNDHLSHDRVVINVKPVIPMEGNDNRPLEWYAPDILTVHAGTNQHVPKFSVTLPF